MKKQIAISLLVALGTQQVAQAGFFVPLAQAGKDTISLASDYAQPLIAAAVVIGLANVISKADVFKEKFGDYNKQVSEFTNTVHLLSGLAAVFTFCYYLEKTGKFGPELDPAVVGQIPSSSKIKVAVDVSNKLK